MPDKAPWPPGVGEWCAEADANPGDKREQGVHAKAASVHRSGSAAEWFSDRSQESILTAYPKKARRAALKSALSAKAAAGNIVVLDQLKVDEPKTKVMVNMLKALDVQKPLVVTAEWDRNVELSTRNIPGAVVAKSVGLNVYDILNSQKLVMTKDAVTKLEEVLI